MNERLEFEENPNNKLNGQCFSLIRLHHPVRNAIGAVKQVYLKKGSDWVWKGDAKITHAATLTLDRINLPMAKLDSAMLPEEFRERFRHLYRYRPRHQLGDPAAGLPGSGVSERIKGTYIVLKKKGEQYERNETYTGDQSR